MTKVILPDGSAAHVDEVIAHGMVFRGEARYVGEQPRRFGDLSGHPLIGSAAARSPSPQPVETNPAPEPKIQTDRPHGGGADMNWIETAEKGATP
jgi:hypothetical protein